MAQFDVYKNPNKSTSEYYPYLLDIQHDVISEINTRIVLPIGRVKHFHNEILDTLTIAIEYASEKLVILTPQIANVPSAILGRPVGSLEHLRQEIIAALEFAITGI